MKPSKVLLYCENEFVFETTDAQTDRLLEHEISRNFNQIVDSYINNGYTVLKKSNKACYMEIIRRK
ncbi:MAG: hypothetical protein ACYDEI_00010 [Erysipelotrichaceae bacterium]